MRIWRFFWPAIGLLAAFCSPNAFSETVTALPASVLQGATGVTTDLRVGSVRVSHGGSAGTVSLELPQTSIVIPCAQGGGYCLAPIETIVRHNISGLRQVSITVGLGCDVPSANFSFIALDLYTCKLGEQRIDDKGQVSIPMRITLQRAVGDPTPLIQLLFNWQTDYAACPAADVPAGGRAAGSCPTAEDNRITLSLTAPRLGEPIFAVSEFLPAFCGAGTYTFNGTRPANIVLRLLDESGFPIASSVPKQVFPGTKKRWGGDCRYGPELVFIPEDIAMPRLTIPPGAAASQVLTRYRLQATIEDSANGSGRSLSNTVEFPVMPGVALTNSKIVLHHDPFNSEDLQEADADATLTRPIRPPGPLSILLSLASGYRNHNQSLYAADIDFAGDEALLQMQISAFDAVGNLVTSRLQTPLNEAPVTNGLHKYAFDVDQFVADGTGAIHMEPQIILRNGQLVRFTPLIINSDFIDVILAGPKPEACTKASPENCLISGSTNRVAFGLAVVPSQPGYRLAREVVINGGNATYVTTLPDVLPPGQVTAITDTIPNLDLPANVFAVLVYYRLLGPNDTLPCERCATALIYYNAFTPPAPVTIGSTVLNVAQQLGNGALTVLNPVLAPAEKKVRSVRANVGLGLLAKDGLDLLNAYIPDKKSAVANPSITGINSTWQFDSTVPRDQNMSARLTLNYSPDQFPDDPNFNEARLQIVSLDPSGALRTFPTTLDTTAKTATATIDSLDPAYSLAIAGPFTTNVLALPPAVTGSAIVNTNAADVTLSSSTFSEEGKAKRANATLRPNARLSAGPSGSLGWFSATSSSTALRGVSWSESGRLLDVAPAVDPGAVFVFTQVEFGARKNTQFRWANTSKFPADTQIALYRPDGTNFGKARFTLQGKEAAGARLDALFPTVPKNFIGYAILSSDQPLTASASLTTANYATAIPAQPVSAANLELMTRYGTRLGETEGVATVHLVNLGSAAARVTLRPRTASGASAAASVTIDLAVNAQYTRALDALFNVAADTIASLQVDSSVPGVLGDLFTVDSSFSPSYGISTALSADLRASTVLPFATNATAVYLFNPNSSAANVGATAFGPDGARGGTTSTTVPAFGRASLQLPSTGSIAIASSTPLLATAVLTTDGGAISGYAALPSIAPAIPPAVSGTRPASSAAGVLNAASFLGGSVAPGEIVTIFGTNFGPPSISLLALQSNNRVATLRGETRFLFDNVAAPIVYAVSGQASVVVPYSVAGKPSTQLVIEYQGRRSDPITLPVAASAPALFSANSSGTGPGAILNQNGSVNSPSRPSDKGRVVILFGTGEGSTTPQVADGSVTPGIVRPTLPVTVTIGGVAQKVLYAGAAPGLVAGVLQVNVEIDPATPSGNQPLIVNVGGVESQAGLTVSISGPVVAAPTITLTPASLDFGSVAVNQARELTVSIGNTGGAPLAVTSITSSNTRFTPLSTSVAVAAGGSQTVTIRFAPTAAGAQSGIITLSSNDPARPTVTLAVSGAATGTTAAPVIEFQPPSLDFGSVAVGQTKDLVVRVVNSGTAALTVTAVISSNPRFSVPLLAGAFSVGSGGSYQDALIRFSPTAAGVQTGTLTFVSNDPAKPNATVAVTGTGTGGGGGGGTGSPAISLSPATLDFGSVTAGQAKDLAVTVTNSGTAPLSVTNVTSSNARFAPLNTSFTVAAGASQALTIRFSPTAAGAQTGTITFASNDAFNPTRAVNVTGTGAASGGGGGGAGNTQLTLTTAAGWPNGRTSNQLPPLAIDGSTSTFTWTTEAFNAANPSYLGVSLGSMTQVNRLRIYKDNDAGGPGLIAKNLIIEYSTSDPSVPLASRTWTAVSGLTNGFNGTELMNAAAVNANGTVSADNHVSQTSGWASLSFNAVNATGIRIGFSNATPISVNHYRVYELQLYGGAASGGGGGGNSSATPVNVGTTYVGTLTTASARSNGCANCYAALYSLTLTTAQRVEIRASSNVFDTYLQLLAPNGTLLAEDDDGGGGTNSRIAGTFQPGTYLIEVTTAYEGQTGTFSLSLVPF